MRRSRILPSLVVGAAGLLSGCSDVGGPQGPEPGSECGASNRFRRQNFTNPTRIDNRYLPLVPGTVFILDGTANRGGGVLHHRVVFTVTDLTKELNGVQTVVLWDRDYNNDVLTEAELAFFGQDDDGNVWTFGEYPEEYQNGVFVGAPSTWIGGLAGADAGILIPGPLTDQPFLQGWAPDVNFLDCGQVFLTGQSACVPFNCYENVLVVDEWSPLETGSGHQRKYYAPGVGNFQIGAVDDPEAETLVLVNILHLSPRELQEARVEALKLEARAYEINEVYRRTPPAQ